MRKQAALVSLLKNMKENFKNLLTNPQKYGIIIVPKEKENINYERNPHLP